MEPKKKLKLIPLWAFFTEMKWVDRALFTVLFLALVGAGVVATLAANDPARWSVAVDEVAEAAQEQVTLRSYTHHFRTLTTEIGAWKEQATFVATRIAPPAWLVLAFIVAQVLGWAYLLASASYVRNVVAYIIFFAFAILVFVAGAIDGEQGLSYWLTNGGLAVLILVPAYLLQQEILRLAFGLRVLIFTVVAAAPFGVQYYQGGVQQLHTTGVGMMPVLAVVGVVWLVFVASDINNLIFFLATNARNPKYRVRFPIIFTAWILLTALEFLMLQKEMGWNLLATGDDIAIRPMYLMVAASLLSVATKQSLGPVLKEYLPNRAMSMAFVALPLIAMSFVAYMVGTGEYLFLHLVERLAISLMFFTGLGHFFYMFYNFGPLIRAKVNFYFLSMMPRKLMYVFVVVLGIAGAGVLEASGNAASTRLLSETIYNQLGDDEVMRGNVAEALLHYRTSVQNARGSVKGNYNLAMLELTSGGDLEKAREHFRHASDYVPFAYAYLNWGNLESSVLNPVQAKTALQAGAHKVRNPYLASNLALVLLRLDQPDSAIVQLKEALALQPENGAFYANLGRLYMENDKPEEAQKFFQAGLELPVVHRAIVTNALFMNMKLGTDMKVSDEVLALPQVKESWETLFNAALERYKAGDLDGAQARLTHGSEGNPFTDSTAAGAMRADSLLLDGMLLFERGQIDRAISRMDYIDVNYPEYRAYTNHFLATAFFGQGLPEMAASYFRRSVENGRIDDVLSEAMMEFDRGNFDYALMQLYLARAADTTLSAIVAREEAKLQMANGDYFFSTIGFDAGSLKLEDWMQIGLAAGASGNKAAALEAFTRAINEDSSTTAPYVEMARISLALGDSLAMDNLEPALAKAPNDPEVNLVHAAILLDRGQVAEAARVAKGLTAKAPKRTEVRVLNARLAAAQGDTTTAIAQLKALQQEFPISPEIVLPLARLYRAKRMDFEGQNMLMAVVEINAVNPDIWYELAHFERLLARPEEAGATAVEAMKNATSLERSRQISEEFKEEIATFRTAHPVVEEAPENGI